jgi:CRISPR-associated exonuclease Cas4
MSSNFLLLLLAALLLLSAFFVLWQARVRRAALGLPAGRVIYSDTDQWATIEQPLYDAEIGLVGKPDYLIESGDQIIPVEVKSHKISGWPYDTHIFQLAAYCLLIYRVHGKKPAYGVLHYPNRSFAIDFTAELETTVLDLINEMQKQGKKRELQRSHQSSARCNRCGYRGICEQRLI